MLNRRSFSDVLPESPKSARKKEEARQAEFVRIGQVGLTGPHQMALVQPSASCCVGTWERIAPCISGLPWPRCRWSQAWVPSCPGSGILCLHPGNILSREPIRELCFCPYSWLNGSLFHKKSLNFYPVTSCKTVPATPTPHGQPPSHTLIAGTGGICPPFASGLRERFSQLQEVARLPVLAPRHSLAASCKQVVRGKVHSAHTGAWLQGSPI